MAILQVRDIPDELYENLSAIAKMENRSISQETIFLLKNALQLKSERITHRKTILAEIYQLKTPHKNNVFPNPADLIREDRDR
jgi:plasmid stability protein